MPKKPNLCMITNQRSGSTWMTRLLDNHPHAKLFFKLAPIKSLKIHYESLLTDKEEILRSISIFWESIPI